MGIGISLSLAPFEDPLLAVSIEGYLWEDMMEELDRVAFELGYTDYSMVRDRLEDRCLVQSMAIEQEVVGMVRLYMEAGNGQISEFDALELVNHIVMARDYFQLTPQEFKDGSPKKIIGDHGAEYGTLTEMLGEWKAQALRSTISKMTRDCYIGDIRMHVESPGSEASEDVKDSKTAFETKVVKATRSNFRQSISALFKTAKTG